MSLRIMWGVGGGGGQDRGDGNVGGGVVEWDCTTSGATAWAGPSAGRGLVVIFAHRQHICLQNAVGTPRDVTIVLPAAYCTRGEKDAAL